MSDKSSELPLVYHPNIYPRHTDTRGKRNDPARSFRDELVLNILDKIAALQYEGTEGMSMENLRQVTPSPSIQRQGCPKGPAEYRAMFSGICANNPTIKAFLL